MTVSVCFFFFSSRRRHTRCSRDWSSDVCSSDLAMVRGAAAITHYLASGPEPDIGNGMLAVRSFKLVLDGALGSRGAEMTEAYKRSEERRVGKECRSRWSPYH